jgi:putative nucleotidyltransferase with HDIG domain
VGLVDAVDSRRYLPHAVVATFVVIVLPATVVLPLAPLDGLADMLLSAALATGISVAAGSAASILWARRPESGEIAFGDLMLWTWLRRVLAERRLARSAGIGGDRRLAALHRISVVMEAGDARTHGHTGRVTHHAERIARQLGLPPEEVAKVRMAAAVHDVGKSHLPRALLAAPERLSGEERALLERHAVEGAEMVAEAGDPDIAAIVRHHHERVDGTGYPDGLAGDEIPLGARIVAVADAYDALTAGAPSVARGHGGALDTLSERAGSQLDAAVVSAFLGYYSARRSIASVAFAATAPERALRWLAGAPAVVGSGVSPLTQGMCVAGAVALAGACVTGPLASRPAPGTGERGGSQAVAPAGGAEQAGDGSQAASRERADRRTGERREPDATPRAPDRSAPGGSAPEGVVAPVPVADGAPRAGTGPEPAPTPRAGPGSEPLPGASPPDPPVEGPEPSLPGVPSDPSELLPSVLESVQEVVESPGGGLAEPLERVLEPVEGLLGGR